MLHFGTTDKEYALTHINSVADKAVMMSDQQLKKLTLDSYYANPSYSDSYGTLLLWAAALLGCPAFIGGTVWLWVLFGRTESTLAQTALALITVLAVGCVALLALVICYIPMVIDDVRESYRDCRLRSAHIQPYWDVRKLRQKTSSHTNDSFALRTFVDTLQDHANLSIWTDFQDRKLKIYLDSALNGYTRRVADMEERLKVGGLTEHEQQLYKDNIRSCAKQSIDTLVDTRADWIRDALPEKVEHRSEADTEG